MARLAGADRAGSEASSGATGSASPASGACADGVRCVRWQRVGRSPSDFRTLSKMAKSTSTGRLSTATATMSAWDSTLLPKTTFAILLLQAVGESWTHAGASGNRRAGCVS